MSPGPDMILISSGTSSTTVRGTTNGDALLTSNVSASVGGTSAISARGRTVRPPQACSWITR